MDIRILPSNIANMIAAGEVVQRPASVVKELMENSVDAGATKISVIIKDAGRTLVQVIDNGCGMDADQAVLCFERHATSKIATAEDLEAIETFGFRGEALASIAAVAEVVLKTRKAGSDVAVQVTITDATPNEPGKQDISQVSAPVGSNFAVRNIFYNTPARRKFLKSDAAELKAIIAEFTRIALSRMDIAFDLVSNDRNIFHLAPAASLSFRIKDLFGAQLSAELLPLEAETSVAGVHGFVSKPDSVRKTVNNQFFFVNGRYFRSPYLHKAVMKAYENVIAEGASPSYFIYLDVDPHVVDINVHPTKTEVKFEDDNVLFSVLMAAVRESIGRSSYRDSLDFDGGNNSQIHGISRSFDEFRAASGVAFTEPSVGEDESFNPFDDDGFPNQKGWGGGAASGKDFAPKQDMSRLFDSMDQARAVPFRKVDVDAVQQTGGQDAVSGQAGGQDTGPARDSSAGTFLAMGRYVACAVPSGLMLVDAVRAMERVLYERFMAAFSREAAASQALMFPVEVTVGAENVPVLEANAALLRRAGFDIAPFGSGSVVVNALPCGLSEDRMSVSAMVYELLTSLLDEQASIAGAIYGPLAEKMAKAASRTVKLPSSADQGRSLLELLYSCDNPEYTSDGHKTVTILGAAEMEKLLK